MAYKEILKHTVTGSAFLKDLKAQILQNLLLDDNHDGAFKGSNVCTNLLVNYWIIFQYVYLLSQFRDAVHMQTI